MKPSDVYDWTLLHGLAASRESRRPTHNAGRFHTWGEVLAAFCLFALLTVRAQSDPCHFAWQLAYHEIPVELPGARFPLWDTVLAYDSARNVAVCYDGRNLGTWEFDGAQAVHRNVLSVGSPGERSYATMAYDGARRVCVLFGRRESVSANELWEYDGESWVERAGFGFNSTNVPQAGAFWASAYDSARERTVFVDYNSTWEWDGTNSFLGSVGPPRSDALIAFDPSRKVLVLFGGLDRNRTYSDDTWTWDGVIWRQVAIDGPPPRRWGSMAFDPRRQVMVLFGGSGSDEWNVLGDTWEWNGVSWALVPQSGSSELATRYGSKMWFDTRDQKMVLAGGVIPWTNSLGGVQGQITNDVWMARQPGYWVDFNAPGLPSVPETGYFHEPFNTLGEAIFSASAGCTINLKAGSSPEVFTISKPLTLDAYYGPVTIGQP